MRPPEELVRILESVQSRFQYQSDQKVWDTVEHWETFAEIPDTGPIIGDCDAHAMACRKLCREQYLKNRLVFCQVETGGYHLVLESGGWILDNRYPEVKSAKELPYKWLRVSGFLPGDPWHHIVT